ncbi:MAG TPA: bifunctional acetate--CoA ligase family protein/GNAT family N-acetyltransferase [Chthoniobacterales bacterium]|nr:bifunctional acetate--CoA ligase family protein/GNAT family N-acetyltransferase [Chthoniobacterales bacterium]
MSNPAKVREESRTAVAERRPQLSATLAPRAIAVIGASELPGSVGRALVENLQSFGDRVFLVNSKRTTVLGQKAFSKIGNVPIDVDLAVIATPAATVPKIVGECAAANVKGAVIISAGFKECGPAGVELEKQILAQRGRMRIIGPNCIGVMLPHIGLNATFAKPLALPGNIGFISQSGALCTAILDWSLSNQLGFSAFISIGSMLDVNWGDLIYHLGDDPHTRSILLYMESVGDARSFLSAAREVALTKPIIVIKVGRTKAAAKAAASHTGALTGSDEVLDAAFRRVGVLRVDTIAELFDIAELLGKQPRPAGPRLAIVTNGGGPGVLATDALIECGGKLAELSPQSYDALDKLLPPHWSRGNPVDILGDADADRYQKAVDIVAHDQNNDGLLAILTPQAVTESSATAEKLRSFGKLKTKPFLASWIGGTGVAPGAAILNGANIPTFEYPDAAARAFCAMWRYSRNLDALYETPALSEGVGIKKASAEKIIHRARNASRTLLTEVESKEILAAYGIPVVQTRIAKSEKDAVDLAKKIGGAVVLKIHSEIITHKSDVDGVKLNLHGANAVRRAYREIKAAVAGGVDPGTVVNDRGCNGAHGTPLPKAFLGVTVQPMIASDGYELILGSSIDAQFGPVLLFGAGGYFVEVFKDRALGLPPLNRTLARRLMEQTQIYTALKGFRGRAAVDLAALEELLVRFSQLVIEQRRIKQIDINPLLASTEQIIALDARIILHERKIDPDNLPRAVIRPYPTEYIRKWKIDNVPVTIRPIRPEDEPLMIEFHKTLSERSVQFRYFGALSLEQRTMHERLRRVCFVDYDREIALVAEQEDRNGHSPLLGVGRLIKEHEIDEAEFAILVGDPWQGKGLGTELLKLLVQIGRKEHVRRIVGYIARENMLMKQVSEEVGFTTRRDSNNDWRAEMNL